jgi:hypothetical protein
MKVFATPFKGAAPNASVLLGTNCAAAICASTRPTRSP